MKKNILIILVALLYQSVQAQTSPCWERLNTITTKWDAPNTSNVYKFDWTLPGNRHKVYLRDGMDNHSLIMELPYFCSNPLGSGNCNNNNTFQYEVLNAMGEPQDIYPENGWELVVNFFGTPNSSTGSGDGKKVSNPFFVLYNKYTGVMKVFVAVLGNLTANSAKLEIGLDQKRIRRAVFAHANIIAKTTQPFDFTAAFSTLNEYNVQASELDYSWLVAEIQTAYDPCTCNNPDFPGFIEITPWIISTSTITASIEGQFTQQLMNGNGVDAEVGGKTSFNDKAVGAIKAGIKSYNQFSGYKDDVNKLLDGANNKYKNKLVKEWFDDYVTKNPQYQGVNNLPGKYALWDALGRTDDAFKKSIGIDAIDQYQTSTNFTTAKTMLGYLPYVGTAIGVIDFLTSGGKKQAPPKPSPPMVFNVSLKLDGQIVNPVQKDPIKFQIPGTNNKQGNLTPFYNNILGVFNVVKPPAVEASRVRGIDNGDPGYYDFNTGAYYPPPVHEAWNIGHGGQNEYFRRIDEFNAETVLLKQYKLSEPIKYLLNPAAQVDVELIDACLVMEYDNSNNLDITHPWIDGDFHTVNQSVPYHNSMFNLGTPIEQRIEEIEKTGLDLEYISHDNKIIRFRTKYVPLTCLMNQSLLLFNGAPPKVYVKMVVKMKRQDDPNAEMISQIVTYDISSSFLNPSEVEGMGMMWVKNGHTFTDIQEIDYQRDPAVLEGKFKMFKIHSGQDLAFPYTLHFPYYPLVENRTYTSGLTGLTINGTLTIPDNSTVVTGTWLKAKKIVTGNNVTIEDGVELISGSIIDFGSEGTMHPNAVLRIEPYGNMEVWSCSDVAITTLAATDAEIYADLCDQNTYKANAKLTKMDEPTDETLQQPLLNENNNMMDFAIFPNPAQNQISLQVSLGATNNLHLSISDIAGRKVFSNLQINQAIDQAVIQIDVSDLKNGVYFCQLTDQNGSTSVKRFVIAK